MLFSWSRQNKTFTNMVWFRNKWFAISFKQNWSSNEVKRIATPTRLSNTLTRLSTTPMRLSTTPTRLSTTPTRLSNTPHETINYPPWDYQLPLQDYQLPPQDYQLPPRDYQIPHETINYPPRDYQILLMWLSSLLARTFQLFFYITFSKKKLFNVFFVKYDWSV